MYYDVAMSKLKHIKNIEKLYKTIIILCGFLALLLIINNLCDKIKPIPKVYTPPENLVSYTGKIYHIFFHSLIIYPELAFSGIDGGQSFKDYMVTRSEFKKILPKLYENNFILINSELLYSLDINGNMTRKGLMLPEGKKPMILSIDDVNYQTDRDHMGFARRLVLDNAGNVATEVITPNGQTVVTRDGDVVPIIDDFVALHPDFSFHGAKGIIAETGFDGVLGYRTNIRNYIGREKDIQDITKIVRKLKETGWQFASHSYSHDSIFKENTITLDQLKYDADKWDREVKPFVGTTTIFIGPFGQIFREEDQRKKYLLSKGFNVFYGVGMDLDLRYFPTYLEMNRADIDGIRLNQYSGMLKEYFDPKEVIDPARNN